MDETTVKANLANNIMTKVIEPLRQLQIAAGAANPIEPDMDDDLTTDESTIGSITPATSPVTSETATPANSPIESVTVTPANSPIESVTATPANSPTVHVESANSLTNLTDTLKHVVNESTENPDQNLLTTEDPKNLDKLASVLKEFSKQETGVVQPVKDAVDESGEVQPVQILSNDVDSINFNKLISVLKEFIKPDAITAPEVPVQVPTLPTRQSIIPSSKPNTGKDISKFLVNAMGKLFTEKIDNKKSKEQNPPIVPESLGVPEAPVVVPVPEAPVVVPVPGEPVVVPVPGEPASLPSIVVQPALGENDIPVFNNLINVLKKFIINPPIPRESFDPLAAQVDINAAEDASTKISEIAAGGGASEKTIAAIATATTAASEVAVAVATIASPTATSQQKAAAVADAAKAAAKARESANAASAFASAIKYEPIPRHLSPVVEVQAENPEGLPTQNESVPNVEEQQNQLRMALEAAQEAARAAEAANALVKAEEEAREAEAELRVYEEAREARKANSAERLKEMKELAIAAETAANTANNAAKANSRLAAGGGGGTPKLTAENLALLTKSLEASSKKTATRVKFAPPPSSTTESSPPASTESGSVVPESVVSESVVSESVVSGSPESVVSGSPASTESSPPPSTESGSPASTESGSPESVVSGSPSTESGSPGSDTSWSSLSSASTGLFNSDNYEPQSPLVNVGKIKMPQLTSSSVNQNVKYINIDKERFKKPDANDLKDPAKNLLNIEIIPEDK